MTKIRDDIAKLIVQEAPPEEFIKLFRSWALEMVKEVRDVNESNGRYNACAEMERKIEEAK